MSELNNRDRLQQDILLLDSNERSEISDGYHSFKELYEHRHALFIALCRTCPSRAWKSRQHDDGGSYDGFFIAGITIDTPDGVRPISYHLPDRLWNYLDVRHVYRSPEWDGHTSDDVVDRLLGPEPLEM